MNKNLFLINMNSIYSSFAILLVINYALYIHTSADNCSTQSEPKEKGMSVSPENMKNQSAESLLLHFLYPVFDARL